MTPNDRGFLQHVTRYIALLITAAVVIGLAGIQAASARPARVSTPYVTASSPHSLTLTWSARPGASRYEVFVSKSKAGASRASARSLRTHGRRTSLKVAGLRSGRAYCFTVRALAQSSAGPRSPAHCHLTMRRSNRSPRTKITMATYNVCSLARGCRSWSKRQRAIVARIVASDADVVAVQELIHHSTLLRKALAPHGYVKMAGGSDDVVYYKSSVFTQPYTMKTYKDCSNRTYDGADPTTDWDRSIRHFYEPDGRWYVYRSISATWETEDVICTREKMKRWATTGLRVGVCPELEHTVTKKHYLFCGVHLTAGNNAKASRTRAVETRQMIRDLDKYAPKLPIIIAGDFNSDRTRADDTPRKELAKAGWFDSYDRSSTYTRPWLSSFNGYRTTPHRSKTWGGHIDRIFIRSSMGSSDWRVMARLRHGRYVGIKPSDHNLVRTTVHLR